MHVAIDLVTAEYQPGGMLLATYALLYGITQIDFTNEYTVITGHPEDYQQFTTLPNIHIQSVKLPAKHATLIQHQIFLPAVLRKVHPDVLHVPAFAAPISWRGALVTTIHDLAFLKVPEQSSLYPRLYHKYLQRAGALRAERVIAISEQTREELVFHWSIPSERIRLIHHALRPSLQPQNIAEDAIATMHSLYGQRYLLHVGRIMPRKNVEKLIEAFCLVADRFSDLHLVLTGGLGHASTKAVQLIETSPHRSRIHLAGWVPEEDLGPLYAGASALVFPSKHEGQGLPTLEAMACGTPVVASPEAASVEIAGDAVLRTNCSDSLTLADAIVRILTDSLLRSKLRLLGLKQVQAFHYEICAKATLQVYQEALDLHHSLRSRNV
ncbi:MAG: glycosyltransferase family 1 protein [Ktedonobacteraceae bacterium]